MGRRINHDKLLAEIAAACKVDATELKEQARADNLYSYDETVMEMQSVHSFYKARVAPEAPKQRQGETKLQFAKRQSEYENNYNAWKIKNCEGCKLDFAYSYEYDGVKFCSLDCLDAALSEIGLRVTPGRDLRKRWGLKHPAIVPSSALATLKDLFPTSFSEHVADAQKDLPKHQPHPAEGHMLDTDRLQDTRHSNTS